MIEKFFIRVGLVAVFVLMAYLIDGYIKTGSIMSLGVAMFGIIDLSIVMYKHNHRY